MDRSQREVLRRKRPIIADLLDFRTESQVEFRELGLLTDEMLPEIKVERTDFGRVFKWLELLPMRGVDAFERLAALLVSRGYVWLSNELHADLDSERCQLHIEEYVFREAGLLVHKNYGRSKRISEVEKKEMQKLLAARYQTAKEAYIRQVKEIQSRLDAALGSQTADSARMKELVQKVHAYLRVEHPRLDTIAHGIEQALDAIAADPDMKAVKEKDQADILDHTLDGLFDILSRELYEKELQAGERKRCMDLLMKELGTEEEKPVFHVDYLLEEVIINYRQHLEQAHREIDVSDKLAKSMEERFNCLKMETDRTLAAKEEQILRLEADSLFKCGTIADLEKKLLIYEEEKDKFVDEIEKWKRRYDQIERTRRLGYYQGYYDRQYYDVNSNMYRRKPSYTWRMSDCDERNRRQLRAINAPPRMLMDDEDDFSVFDGKDSRQNKVRSSQGKQNSPRRGDTPRLIDTTPPIDENKAVVVLPPAVRRSKQSKAEKMSSGTWRY